MSDPFSSLQPFESGEYSLFGTDEQPVNLDELVKTSTEYVAIKRNISQLTRQNAWRLALQVSLTIISIVGMSGLAAVTACILLFLYVPTITITIILSVAAIFLFFLVRLLVRDDDNRTGNEYFFVSEFTQNIVNPLAAKRQENISKKRELKTRLNIWQRIPEAVRADVRRLVALIRDYDANVRLYNAETKRAKFYVERGYFKLEESEKGLSAMRSTLDLQKRELVETIANADAACITLVCQPEGDRALISPDLENLREKLNGLSGKVREQLALETIINRELKSPDEDYNHRLLTAQAAKKPNE